MHSARPNAALTRFRKMEGRKTRRNDETGLWFTYVKVDVSWLADISTWQYLLFSNSIHSFLSQQLCLQSCLVKNHPSFRVNFECFFFLVSCVNKNLWNKCSYFFFFFGFLFYPNASRLWHSIFGRRISGNIYKQSIENKGENPKNFIRHVISHHFKMFSNLAGTYTHITNWNSLELPRLQIDLPIFKIIIRSLIVF